MFIGTGRAMRDTRHLVSCLGLDGGLILENNIFPSMPILMPHRTYTVPFERLITALSVGGLPAGAFSPSIGIFGNTILEQEMLDICL